MHALTGNKPVLSQANNHQACIVFVESMIFPCYINFSLDLLKKKAAPLLTRQPLSELSFLGMFTRRAWCLKFLISSTCSFKKPCATYRKIAPDLLALLLTTSFFRNLGKKRASRLH